MPPDNFEKKLATPETTPKQEKKQVWQIVSEIYGKGWKNVMPKLAVKFGICKTEQEYVDARNSKDKTKNINYNIEIGNRLQKGERLGAENIDNQIKKFSPEKQNFLRANTNGIDQQHLVNLKEEDIKKLNDIKDLSQFEGFLRNQKESIQKNKEKVSRAGGFENQNIDQAVVNLELFEFDNHLDAFLNRGEKDGFITAQDRFNAKKVAAESTEKADAETIKQAGGKEELLKQLERMELVSMAKKKGLDEKYGSEFDNLAISLYNIQKNSPWLQKFRDAELLKYVKDKIVSMYDAKLNSSNDALDAQKGSIIKALGEEYMNDKTTDLKSLVADESQKDDKYKEQLKNKYTPTLQTQIDGVYESNMIRQQDRKLFDENTGTFRKDVSEADKKRFPQEKIEKLQGDLKKKFDIAESEILREWNPAIKMQAVSTCIDTLRACMNFSLDDYGKENLLKQFTNVESDLSDQENSKDKVVKIKGKIGNKDLVVYYNLSEGTIATKKFLKKDKKAEIYYLDSEENGREEIPLLRLPKLSDFTAKVESRGDDSRKQILQASENIQDMKKKLQTKLDADVKTDYMPDIDSSYFEKNAVQNMFTQELMVDFMHVPQDNAKFKNGISSGNRDEEGYFQLCELIGNAANWYTRDELRKGRETIKEMKDIKEKGITYDPEINPMGDRDIKNNNPERFFFEMAFCPRILNKPSYRNMPADNTYLKFFQCFKSPKSDSFPMVDLDMLGDYKNRLRKKTNIEEENTIAWRRTPTFQSNMESMESKLTADTSMEKNLDDAYKTA